MLKDELHADSGDFVQLRPKSIGVRSEKKFGNGCSSLSSDQIKKLQFPVDQPTEHL